METQNGEKLIIGLYWKQKWHIFEQALRLYYTRVWMSDGRLRSQVKILVIFD